MGESKAGRPTDYFDKVEPFLNDISNWVLLGYTHKEIYEKLGISHNAFCEYKNKYNEFNEALSKFKALPKANVVNALYKRAVGYQYEEVSVTRKPVFTKSGMPVYGADGKQLISEERTVTIKEVPPETKAIQYFTLNRDRDNWKITSSSKIEENKTTDNKAIDKVFDLLDEARKDLLNKDNV